MPRATNEFRDTIQGDAAMKTEDLELDSILIDLQHMIDAFEFQRQATEITSLRFEILTAQIIKLRVARNKRIDDLLAQ